MTGKLFSCVRVANDRLVEKRGSDIPFASNARGTKKGNSNSEENKEAKQATVSIWRRFI